VDRVLSDEVSKLIVDATGLKVALERRLNILVQVGERRTLVDLTSLVVSLSSVRKGGLGTGVGSNTLNKDQVVLDNSLNTQSRRGLLNNNVGADGGGVLKLLLVLLLEFGSLLLVESLGIGIGDVRDREENMNSLGAILLNKLNLVLSFGLNNRETRRLKERANNLRGRLAGGNLGLDLSAQNGSEGVLQTRRDSESTDGDSRAGHGDSSGSNTNALASNGIEANAGGNSESSKGGHYWGLCWEVVWSMSSGERFL